MKFSSALSKLLTQLSGWQVEIAQPIPPKCVIIGAHHTTNWDFPLTILLKLKSRLPFRFIAKKSLFVGPFGWIMKRLGGIPLDRKSSKNFVSAIVETFNGKESWMVAISPEGTRGYAPFWKSGFYHIANGAQVPIVFGYADYRRKVVGFGPVLQPTGDIDSDFLIIRDFYDQITPAYPDNKGPVALKTQELQEPNAKQATNNPLLERHPN